MPAGHSDALGGPPGPQGHKPERDGDLVAEEAKFRTSTGLVTSLMAATEDKASGNLRLWHYFHMWNKNKGS